MYELEKFGSFHVGGRLVEVKGKPKRTIWFTETNSHEQDPNGKFLIEQLYVLLRHIECYETAVLCELVSMILILQ